MKIQIQALRLTFAFLAILLTGCETLKEAPKVVWGSSTKALEEARPQAIVKTYQVNLLECFDKVLNIAQEESLTVFIKDKRKRIIVLMGFEGSIETTEVGVFLTAPESGQTKVEVVSLSPEARLSASKLLFLHLSKAFKEI